MFLVIYAIYLCYYSDVTLLCYSLAFGISRPAYESTALLKAALQAVIKDRGFQIPSPSAKEAHLAASHMLEWLGNHSAHVESLVDPLTRWKLGK